ncbi:MAG: DUF2892 domain-containing protein [Thermogutta sp.]|uniref:YgaP family membrane protein n=1 Tax=Thermogutta sp. TaxID=1962930 RepID=UPI00199BB170|nr:DUF2892 domain-containing protein [Thermogutta sp.]MBC7351466.1 DUF2892 domain-containing protein [Thermogutta sp.]
MTIERGLRLMAGIVVTVSAVLAWVHSPYWLILTIFAGLNLFQSAFTNWCPAVWILSKLGLQPCCPCDPQKASQNAA